MSKPPTEARNGQLAQKLAQPTLRTPRTGKGKLLTGGKPGHKGGRGRAPDAIRATLRAAFDKRVPLLQAFVDDESLDPIVRMKAADMLAKYGLGTTFTQTDDKGKSVVAGIAVTLVQPAVEPNRLRPVVAKALNAKGHNGHNGNGS